MSNQYPLSGVAALLASRGRHGDSMIVHMNPVEVAGIAALTPKGLTVNPDTGQLEAFNFMESVLPMVGAAAMVAATGGIMAAPLAAGLGSGLTTAAVTGDLERGAISGVMGAAGGAAMSGAGNMAGDAAAKAVASETGSVIGNAATPALADAATSTITGGMEQALIDTASKEAAAAAAQQGAEQYAAQQTMGGLDLGTGGTDIGVLGSAGQTPTPEQGWMSKAGDALKGQDDAYSQMSPSDRLIKPFTAQTPEGKNAMMSEVMQPRTALPIMMGGSMMAEMNAADQGKFNTKAQKEKEQADLKGAYNDLQRGYAAAQPGAMTGYNPYRSKMSNRTPLPTSYGATGGLTRMGNGGRIRRRDSIGDMNRGAGAAGTSYSGYSGYGRNSSGEQEDLMGGGNPGYSGIDPVTVQQNLSGQNKVAAPANYRPGFDPEWDYFQNDPITQTVENPTPPQEYAPLERMEQPAQPYFDSVLPPRIPIPDPNKPQGKAEGGMVGVSTPMGDLAVPDSGIARIPPQAPPQAPPQQPQQPTPEDVQMLAAALMGQAGDQTDQIVEMFVQKYGPEIFQMIRQLILSQGNPNAQTEGMVQGQGGGMDDQVMGTIGSDQPVAVSPGEYIVPADVVSGLGDGSSDAGAAELDRMAADTRMARGGTTNQPPPFDARKVMPA